MSNNNSRLTLPVKCNVCFSDSPNLQVISHPVYQQSQRISIYLSTSDEVGTEGILKHMFANNKKCFVPQYIGPRMDMLRLQSIEDYDTLPLTKWNIKQPGENEEREEALSTGSNKFLSPKTYLILINNKFVCTFP